MGAVYEAVNEKSGQQVALKVLLPEYARNRDLTERLFREARALGRLRHTGIVEVLDYGEVSDGTAYLAMEHLHGHTLSDWHGQRPGPLPTPLVLGISEQIASALATAHEKGVIHRDVKPGNVMMIEDREMAAIPRVKLLDFGIAKLAQDTRGKSKTATDLVIGTPYYMSPEQCQGAGYVDAKSDVYSLGVMLFELLSGQLPFDGEGSGQVLGMHIFKDAPHLRELAPQVPVGLADLVDTLLAKEKAQRPTMKELAAELERMQRAGGAPVASPLAMTRMSVKPASRGSRRQDTTLGASQGQRQSFSRRVALIGVLIAGPLALAAIAAVRIGPKASSSPVPEATPPQVVPIQKPVQTIRWIVTSSPIGAEVVSAEDGRVLGKTPWNMEQQPASGTVSLHLRLSGYQEEPLSLEREMSQKVHVNLRADQIAATPPPPTGRPVTRKSLESSSRNKPKPKTNLGGFEFEN